MEPREQRGLVIAALAKITPKNGLWVVPSQTHPDKRYLVNPFQRTCTCPDHADGHKCKHIFAVEFTIKREMNADGSITETATLTVGGEKKTYSQNWSAYNLAQTTEKHRFQVLLHDLSKSLVNPPTGKSGRPRVPLSDAVFALAFKVYSTFSSRRFMSDLTDAVQKGYISQPMHFNSISHYLEWDNMTSVLTGLIQKSSLPLRSVEATFAADSTGFSTSRFVRWFDEKYGVTRSGHDWVKAHIMCGVKTNVITAVEIHARNAGDAPLFRPLLNTTAKNFQIAEIAGDKAYLSESNIEAAFAAGATPYIPFKPNSTDAKGGLWEKMLNLYRLKQEEFMKHYHQRSNVEATFSMVKAKFRDHVRSRSDTSMRNEVLGKFLCHNICCVIQSQCELGIEPVFWGEKEPLAEPVLVG